MARSNDGELPTVEAGDLSQAEPLAHHDHGGVGGAERQTLTCEHEFGRAGVVLTGQLVGQSVPSASEVKNCASTLGPPLR